MKHLPGSLKSLAGSFDLGITKGFFPHLFNVRANANYGGPIPPKEYFDVTSFAKKPEDLVEFYEWYDSFTGEWNLKEEMIKYCENDVEILAQILQEYHDTTMDKTGFSPLGYTTGPSVTHYRIRRSVVKNYDLGSLDDDIAAQEHQLNVIAKTAGWACLLLSEYFHARGALRGGRTDVRCPVLALTGEQLARGCIIKYVDIVSQYPYAQLANLYPVGTPMIEVYDWRYKPCHVHAAYFSATGKTCDCSLETTGASEWLKPEEVPDPTKEYILEKAKVYGGFITARVKPPANLFHPILISYDAKRNKAMATLEVQTGTWTMAEFSKALENGYEIEQVFRIDWYHMKEGLWNEEIADAYVDKMKYSNHRPTPEQEQDILRDYAKFGDHMLNPIRKSFPDWGKNGGKKAIAKIVVNSGWGKQCQKPIMDECTMTSPNEDIFALAENWKTGSYVLSNIQDIGDRSRITTRQSVKNPVINLHTTYLPAAVYVSAYGRLQLWGAMNILGARVLYHDTDSIIYIYDPLLPNIPEGKVLGDFDREDIDAKNGGIVEFIGACAKTYGIKMANGKVMVKAKGISQKNATQSLVSYEKLKQNILAGLRGEEEKISVPQTTFNYKTGRGIHSYDSLKSFGFTVSGLKGKLINGHVYPFGYDESLIN